MVCSERPPNGAPQHIVNFAQNGIRPAMLIETHPRSALAFGSFGREGLCSSCTPPAVGHLAVNASKTRIKMLSLMGHFCRWWVLTDLRFSLCRTKTNLWCPTPPVPADIHSTSNQAQQADKQPSGTPLLLFQAPVRRPQPTKQNKTKAFCCGCWWRC